MPLTQDQRNSATQSIDQAITELEAAKTTLNQGGSGSPIVMSAFGAINRANALIAQATLVIGAGLD